VLVGDSRFCSPWVLSVWLALEEKGLPYRLETFDLERGEHRGAHAARTLAGKVPALRHGDLWIAESLAILEYLEEVFAPPSHPALFPATPAERAADREILNWLRTDLFELRRCLPYEGIFLGLAAQPLTPKAEAEIAALVSVAKKRVAVARPRLTLADLDLGLTLRRLVHYGVGLEPAGPVRQLVEDVWRRPGVQKWVSVDRARFKSSPVRDYPR
jgi:glutathione S-transferase